MHRTQKLAKHEGGHHARNCSGKNSGIHRRVSWQASRATSAVANAIQDGVGVVRRVAQRGVDAAEELLNDTTQRMQRHLVLTVATTFAVGFTAGTLIGCMMKRRQSAESDSLRKKWAS
jgi:hypothetical protein